ncbi:sensor histidine kinase [Nocardioides dilutus]
MSRAGAAWQRVPAPVIDILLVAVAALDVWLNTWDTSRLVLSLGAVGCTALAFRRRFPIAVFLLTLPIALTQDVALAVLVSLFTVAERIRDRRVLAACLALAALAGTNPWFLDEIDRTTTLAVFVYSLATAAAPVLLGQLLQAHRDLSRRLVEIQEAREHERALHAQTVLARERTQLAREMHDVVSHQVSLIAVRAGALQVATVDDDAREAARTIRGLCVTTLDELRTMVALLRASGGRTTELSPQPTLADLRKLVETSGTQAELSGELPPDVGTPAQRAVYRTVQESLTNVRKHAPGASARVDLWQDGDEVGVTVTNTPAVRPSLSLPGSGHGLVGLRERAELLHGTLQAGPIDDGGYRVTLRIPFGAE